MEKAPGVGCECGSMPAADLHGQEPDPHMRGDQGRCSEVLCGTLSLLLALGVCLGPLNATCAVEREGWM